MPRKPKDKTKGTKTEGNVTKLPSVVKEEELVDSQKQALIKQLELLLEGVKEDKITFMAYMTISDDHRCEIDLGGVYDDPHVINSCLEGLKNMWYDLHVAPVIFGISIDEIDGE